MSTTVAALDGRDHVYHRKIAPKPSIRTASTMNVSTVPTTTVWASTAPIPTTAVRSTQSTTNPPKRIVSLRPSMMPENILSVAVESTPANGMEVPSNQPLIRVKAVESLTNTKQTSMSSDSAAKPHGLARKRVTVRSIVRHPDGTFHVKQPNTIESQQHNKTSTDQCVRIANVTGAVSIASSSGSNGTATYSKFSAPAIVQPQPVKLWNNMMPTHTKPTPLKVHVSVKTRNESQEPGNGTLSPPKEQSAQENLIENAVNEANDGASMLKIGQVFEGVNEDFEDLFLETDITPSMLEEAVKDMEHDTPTKRNNNNDAVTMPRPKVATAPKPVVLTDDNDKLVTIVQNNDKSCNDYRCNICLTFNDSLEQYRDHMDTKHAFKFTCENCHDAFGAYSAFYNHLKSDNQTLGSLRCTLSANAKRTYICIVEPPIILMRNEKVFAFRCKNCDLAFQNQRNYVQHAQRHAKLFRCKLCPTKPLTMDLMRQHLNHHKN